MLAFCGFIGFRVSRIMVSTWSRVFTENTKWKLCLKTVLLVLQDSPFCTSSAANCRGCGGELCWGAWASVRHKLLPSRRFQVYRERDEHIMFVSCISLPDPTSENGKTVSIP